jgi:hypothetical protein
VTHESRPVKAAHEDLAGGSITSNGGTNASTHVADPLGAEGRAWRRGYRAALDACEARIRQAKWDADRLWLLTFAPADRRGYLLSRLDRFAAIAYDEGEIDRHLEESFTRWCASLDNVREVTA